MSDYFNSLFSDLPDNDGFKQIITGKTKKKEEDKFNFNAFAQPDPKMIQIEPDATDVDLPPVMSIPEKENQRLLEKEQEIAKVGKAIQDRIRTGRTADVARTPFNTLMAGLETAAMPAALGIEAVKGMTGSKGGADPKQSLPSFLGNKYFPGQYEGQDLSITGAVSEDFQKNYPITSAVTDFGLSIAAGSAANKVAKAYNTKKYTDKLIKRLYDEFIPVKLEPLPKIKLSNSDPLDKFKKVQQKYIIEDLPSPKVAKDNYIPSDKKVKKKYTPEQTAAFDYYKKATSEENFKRARALDIKEGTNYVERLKALQKQYFENSMTNSPLFNIKREKIKSLGSSGLTKEAKKKYLTELVYGNRTSKININDRQIEINSNIIPWSNQFQSAVNHEMKHHYTLSSGLLKNAGRDFYENPYFNQYSDLIYTPSSAVTSGVGSLKKALEKNYRLGKNQYDYFSSPWEVDAYAFTNLKDDLVDNKIIKTVFDKITEDDFYKMKKLKNIPSSSKGFLKLIDKNKAKKFVKLFNESVYKVTGAAATGAAANSLSKEQPSFKYGGMVNGPKDPPKKKSMFEGVKDWWYNYDKTASGFEMGDKVDDGFVYNWINNPYTAIRISEMSKPNTFMYDKDGFLKKDEDGQLQYFPDRKAKPEKSIDDAYKEISTALQRLKTVPVFKKDASRNTTDLDYAFEKQGIIKNPVQMSLDLNLADMNTAGYYLPSRHLVKLEKESPNIIAHELTHATGMDYGQYQGQREQDMLDAANYRKDWEDKFIYNDNYRLLSLKDNYGEYSKENFEKFANDPKYKQRIELSRDELEYLKKDGMFPRMMEIRRYLEMEPGQIMTQEMLNKAKETKAYRDLDIKYNDKNKLRLFNRVADNSKMPNVTYAKYGALIDTDPPKKKVSMTKDQYDRYKKGAKLTGVKDNIPVYEALSNLPAASILPKWEGGPNMGSQTEQRIYGKIAAKNKAQGELLKSKGYDFKSPSLIKQWERPRVIPQNQIDEQVNLDKQGRYTYFLTDPFMYSNNELAKNFYNIFSPFSWVNHADKATYQFSKNNLSNAMSEALDAMPVTKSYESIGRKIGAEFIQNEIQNNVMDSFKYGGMVNTDPPPTDPPSTNPWVPSVTTSTARGGKLKGDNLRGKTLNQRLYESITPIGYSMSHAFKEFKAGKRLPFMWDGEMTSFEDFDKMDRWRDPETGKLGWYGKHVKEASDDHSNYYFNQEQKYDTFYPSKYKPSTNTGEDVEYMQFEYDDDIFDEAAEYGMFDAKVGTNKQVTDSAAGGFTLKNYTLSRGSDERGDYISYYDKVDFAPSLMGMKVPVEKFVGKPYDFYGRMYYTKDEEGKVKRVFPKDPKKKEFSMKDFLSPENILKSTSKPQIDNLRTK